jgi:hypothetical protein
MSFILIKKKIPLSFPILIFSLGELFLSEYTLTMILLEYILD